LGLMILMAGGLVWAADKGKRAPRKTSASPAKQHKDLLPVLLEALKDQDDQVRQNAAEALTNLKADAVPGLLEVLKEKGETREVRRSASGAISQILVALQKQRNAPRRVHDPKPQKLVEEFKDLVAVLVETLNDADSEVRENASNALRPLGADS